MRSSYIESHIGAKTEQIDDILSFMLYLYSRCSTPATRLARSLSYLVTNGMDSVAEV